MSRIAYRAIISNRHRRIGDRRQKHSRKHSGHHRQAINKLQNFHFSLSLLIQQNAPPISQRPKIQTPAPERKNRGEKRLNSFPIPMCLCCVATGLIRILTKNGDFFQTQKKNFPPKKIRQSRRRCLLLQNKKGGGKDGGGGSGAGMGYNVGGLCWRGGAGGAKGEAGEKQ